MRRFLRFNLIGLVGIIFQLAALWLLSLLGLGYLVASSAAIILTVVHNFVWHRLWTWADRAAHLPGPLAFGRFFLSNGLVSLTSNLALMPFIVGTVGIPAVPANLVVIVVAGVLNFVVADRVAFRALPPLSSRDADADADPAPYGA